MLPFPGSILVVKPCVSVAENEFECASCGGVFPKAWSDAEAEAEAKQDPYGLHSPPADDPFNGETVTVCVDCYRAMEEWVKAHGTIEKAMACGGKCKPKTWASNH